jgi:hypothetical protein
MSSPPNEDSRSYPKRLDWLRYFCAFMLYMYGTSKLLHLQFNVAELAPRPIGSLNGYQLTWFYFGYSRIYALILGATQVGGATLLLFRKTTLLGAATMLPVMANILLINIFILVNDYGPYVISAIICSSLSLILWHQRAALLSLFWTNQTPEPMNSSRTHRWIRTLIVAGVSAIMISGLILQRYVKRKRAQPNVSIHSFLTREVNSLSLTSTSWAPAFKFRLRDINEKSTFIGVVVVPREFKSHSHKSRCSSIHTYTKFLFMLLP